jgi:hypothetical protein
MSARRESRRERRAARRASALDRSRNPAQDRGTGATWNPLLSGGALALAILVLVAVIYAPVHSYQFTTLDDPQYVSANPVVAQGLTRAGLAWAFAFTGSFYWHPLTWLSHMADVQLFGMDAGAHHLVNVVIHAANSALLFAALNRMTGAPGRSAFVAAVFAAHPLHVESVAWIAERKDVLSTFFWMAALYFYGAYARDHRFRTMVVVTALFAAGLLAKPMILTLPFVLLLLDYWPLKRVSFDSKNSVLPLVREKLPLFALAIASVVVTLLSQRGSAGVVALEALSPAARIGNAVVSYAVYLRDAIWPARLAAFYPFEQPSPVEVISAAVLIIAITVAVARFRRSHPYLPVGWLWYIGTLVPVIGILQAGDQGRADRFTYVPLIGVAIAVAWLAADLVHRIGIPRRALTVAGAAIVVALAFVARGQLAHWKDDLAVWSRAVSVTSNNYRAENHFGVALTDRGRLQEGIQHYEAALRIWPDYPEAHNNLGTARVEQGRIDDAIRAFSEAARLKPSSATFHYNLGVVLSNKGDTAAALASVRRALALSPGNAQYLEALAALGGR